MGHQVMAESYDPDAAGIDDSAGSAPIQALRALIASVERMQRAASTRYGLSTSEAVALRELEVNGSLTPSDIAQRTGLTSSSVTNLVDRLERLGLARRRAHPDDRRSVLIDLTEEGTAALAWGRALLAQAYAGFGSERMPGVLDSLTQLAASLDVQAERIARGEV